MADIRGGAATMTGQVIALKDFVAALHLGPGMTGMGEWLTSIEVRLQKLAVGRLWFGYSADFLSGGNGPGGFLDAGEAFTWAAVNLKASNIYLYGSAGDQLYVTVTS